MASFVYFDLGGVVILDFSGTEKWNQLQKEIGVPEEKGREFEAFFSGCEAGICTGREIETALPLLKRRFGVKIPQDYSLLTDGFLPRLNANRSIWPVIEKVRKGCRIGLLTNMYSHMLDAIREKGILPRVDWDVIIDSSVVGMKKPDQGIFELAEKRAGAKGEEILFVDNTRKHIEAAERFGWRTLLYDQFSLDEPNERLLEMLNDA